MLTDKAPVSFIATDQPDAAQRFFVDVLGLHLQEVSPFALVFEDEGHTLRVQIVSGFSPPAYTVYGWQVANIAQQIKKLTAKGVRFEQFDQLGQDGLGIWTTPNGHRIAWFKDPSGNTLSLTEYVA